MTPWNDADRARVVELLEQFNGADEVAAVMDCAPEDLPSLVLEAFGADFETIQAKYSARGRARLRGALTAAAEAGDMKALDMLAREQLGMDPVKARRASMQEQPAESEPEPERETLLQVIQGRARHKQDDGEPAPRTSTGYQRGQSHIRQKRDAG